VIIPQQSGDLRIDPAELVCLVNVKTKSGRTGSIFDDFFDDGYKTVRKRISTPAITVHVSPLPAGAPASFGGGVGEYNITAKLSKDSLKTHDAASVLVTISGNGNVSLLTAPKVKFHPDMDVYDVKTTESTDKGSGSTSGSKTFEYPFIPRSAGDFVIPPIEYSYYDSKAGRYVTVATDSLAYHVEKGSANDPTAQTVNTLPTIDRKGVQNLGEDIRFIQARKPSLSSGTKFFVGRPLYWILAALLALAALIIWLATRKMAALRADVAGTKNRKATKMAMNRLKQAGVYLKKDVYSAFYEELHKALLGFIADKLNMGVEDLSKDNIAAQLKERGVSDALTDKFVGLLDACEFARYSPEGGNEAMSAHYQDAIDVISSIDSSMKSHKGGFKAATMIALLLAVAPAANAADSYVDSLWNRGVQAYNDGQWETAANAWGALNDAGIENAVVYYNLGNAWFKIGEYPKAILNYERALKLNPSYADARFNLEFANSQIKDKIDEVPEFVLKSWMRKLCYCLSSNVWSVLSLLFLAGFLAMALLFLLSAVPSRRRWGFFSGIVLLLLSIMALSFARWQYKDYRKADSAIVMSPVSSVKSSPSNDSSTDLFVLHGGTKVKILDQVNDWKNVSLSDGRQGWIRSSDIEII